MAMLTDLHHFRDLNSTVEIAVNEFWYTHSRHTARCRILKG